ncbi:nitrate ABC transporter ATP-binding protein [Herbaspirillum rubrisubalbicans]|jgi:NitT/TauT family transport system ATP-binding protein|uniref:Nitrate ABC transporter ATP-binding protein n=2 Tax=Herbaspirillum rubrisubalbicans TaxID=80842 RepID=A0ABX9BWN6_9BURK|nr:ABC transporter ATP-binding protein [Herbaspirillum rubrisubalbicans]MCP1576766.1 NitT/TauT family transport system ATP-binding protein [Herbaspirillum rubrisubalbicans]NQE49145.1 nitrate ABC transporter ATP-binding protein [Herbaspirillum rubrisubalbicans]QJP99998.1 nitrate ABC transporter ATP-binding protein [Herbaspirillum rubrisubalbicans Os34]RAM62323.1 nitrate ABC transporter ATP-binding protein [Herbaspirillum rubrisubalbicans]RAN49652.1 nitrate ABC transporter ATP-binding protein [H
MSVVISPKVDLPLETPFVPGPPGTHITIRGLTKYFAGWPLYENFDLDIPKQQIVSVFGPNGCGKSTLINMIAGLIPIDAGQILFDGKSLAQTKIGYVFQNYRDALFPWLRTIDNIAYPLKLEGKSKAEIKYRVDELVASFDVKFDLMRYPYELSGGQQQTASIMRALAPGPEVLFLDEPFSALDFEMTLFIREKLQQVFLQTGTTMVLVSHDLEEAVYLADQILLLTKRPTAVADILHYQDRRPRTVETLSQPGFIAAKKLSMEIFQREVRKPARMQAPGSLALS